MKRRDVLKGMATGSAMSIGIGSAAARTDTGVESVENLDAVHVARSDKKIVRTVEDPTAGDLDRLREEISADEQLVSPECTTKCRDDCGYDCCGYRCYCKTCDDGSKVCDGCSCPDGC